MIFDDVRQPFGSTLCAVMPRPFSTTRRLPEVSKTRPRGWVKPPATFVALHPLAVFTGKASFVTSAHDAGTPVCIGPGDAEGTTLVLRVDGLTLTVELGTGAQL
jgi:hypothetical protein